MNPLIISVSQLNRYVKSLIEDNKKLSSVFIQGEISNFKLHSFSGHAYFSLKDSNALVKCVCFRDNFARIKFDVQDGLKVLCQGKLSLYEKEGVYQLYVYSMIPDGVGENALALEQLKEKLASEGLFSVDRKRPIPKFPKRIAVVTSSQGAALRDICNIIERRYPLCEVLVCPVQVQGIYASASIVSMLDKIYKTPNIDTIIIARGGGASEDLSAFNDEALARRVAASPIPVISAVGHETDFTICDYVADLRVPTPSAAAELAVPDINNVIDDINIKYNRIKRLLNQKITDSSLRLDLITKSNVLTNVLSILTPFKTQLDELNSSLINNTNAILAAKQENFIVLASKLDTLSPLKTLSRGYSAVYKDNKIVRSVNGLQTDDELQIKVIDGTINCKVI